MKVEFDHWIRGQYCMGITFDTDDYTISIHLWKYIGRLRFK